MKKLLIGVLSLGLLSATNVSGSQNYNDKFHTYAENDETLMLEFNQNLINKHGVKYGEEFIIETDGANIVTVEEVSYNSETGKSIQVIRIESQQ